METQMLIRLNKETKYRLSRLAREAGKKDYRPVEGRHCNTLYFQRHT